MIEFDHVTKRYASQTETPALDNLSCLIGSGGLTAVVGPSGSGKSTFLRCINRMVEPDTGEIRIGGTRATSLDPVILRRSTGYVIQGIGLFPHMTVAGNIGVVPSLLGWSREKISLRVASLLDLVRLPLSWAERYPHQLSGGEAQRVGVARALAADPPLLLMDEPFGALDALTRVEMQTEFDRIRRKLSTTVILVTHDLLEAFRLADRILILRSGKIARDGTPAQLLSAPDDPLIEEFLSGIRSVERLMPDSTKP